MFAYGSNIKHDRVTFVWLMFLFLTGCLHYHRQTPFARMEIQSVVSFPSWDRLWGMLTLTWSGHFDINVQQTLMCCCVCSRLQRSVFTSRRWSLCPSCCWPSSWSLWFLFSCCTFVQRKSIASVRRAQSRLPGECCMASMVRLWNRQQYVC